MNLKFLTLILFFITFFNSGLIVAEAKSAETISQERYDRVCKWGILNPPECKKRIIKTRPINKNNTVDTSKEVNSSKQTTQKKNYDRDCRWGIFNPPKCRRKDKIVKNDSRNESYKEEKRIKEGRSFEKENHNLSIYTGTFDTIDKVGDDQTSLIGLEHKNTDLFRDTWIGRFSPTTGAFVTGKSSIYLYTGIEADYNFGRINISPSFAPGYYEAGDGKNLGSALEFKSELKIGVDLFKNSNLGYSYSHISNNDWGDINPGTDNQSITFSKKF
jgi:lipid A 3-O-deacylase